jgi:glycosyltransferase involved in cell wall biosynthesis
MTTVTIGLPVFNGQRFLRECLNSLQAQSFADFELIISDNASTDGTPDVVAEYARHDPRIRFERSLKNHGAAWNHRRVLGLARSRYFKWCGADDICHPDFLAMCIAALERSPAAVLAFPKAVIIDEAGVPVTRTGEHLPLESRDVVERFTALMSAVSVTQNPFYGVMRRAILGRARPMGAYLASDRCLMAELALLGPFALVPEYLMERRVHAGNKRTHTDDQRFFHPATPDRFRTREWRVLGAHIGAIARAPVALSTKLRLFARLASWIVQQRVDLASEARALLLRRRVA